MNTINWLTFLIGGFIPTVFLSTWIVARFIWIPMKKQFEAMKMPPRPYYMRYIIEDDEFNSKDKPIDTNNFVIEDTPKGTVLMKYSKINEGFDYWCDYSIPYIDLETVARKYVLTFHCINLYIDRIREKRKVIEDSKNPKKIKRNPLFATFKSYNNVKKNLSIAANKFIYRDKFKECLKFTVPSAVKVKKTINFAAYKKLFF